MTSSTQLPSVHIHCLDSLQMIFLPGVFLLPVTGTFPRIFLKDGESIVETGNISSTTYPATSFISSVSLVVAPARYKSNFCCLAFLGLQPSSAASLVFFFSTSFTLTCCRRRCFRRFEVVLIAVDKVLVPQHNLHVTLMFLSSFLPTRLK